MGFNVTLQLCFGCLHFVDVYRQSVGFNEAIEETIRMLNDAVTDTDKEHADA